MGWSWVPWQRLASAVLGELPCLGPCSIDHYSQFVCNGNFTIATNIIIVIHLVVNSKINTKSHLWSWSAGIILFSTQMFTLLHCHCLILPRHCLLLQIHCQDIAKILPYIVKTLPRHCLSLPYIAKTLPASFCFPIRQFRLLNHHFSNCYLCAMPSGRRLISIAHYHHPNHNAAGHPRNILKQIAHVSLIS